MRKIDAYLSREAQVEWPTALVWKEVPSPGNGTGGERFVLEREGYDDIILGHHFREARAGLEVYLASAWHKRQKAGKDAEAM